jgi:signal transduction histidine kinase
MREVIEDAVTATSQIFKENKVELEVTLPEAVPVIAADRDRLMQVMLNLLSNAAKFCVSDGGGRVRITLSPLADSLQVDVQDNGIGISDADQKVIFEKFRQVGDTLTAKPRGTGLGLPICREIIGHFGGKLWVQSQAGSGATFSFTIPYAHATRPEQSAVPAASAA